MKVHELIAFLQTQPQHLDVIYNSCSEFCLLEEGDIDVQVACMPRPDGWIQRKRDDKTTQQYLVLP